MRLKRYMRITEMVAFIAVAALILAACSSGGGDTASGNPTDPTTTTEAVCRHAGDVEDIAEADTTVAVDLFESVIEPEVSEAAAGNIGFVLDNVGALDHEFYIAKADDVAELPLREDGRVDVPALDEEGLFEGEVKPFPPGEKCDGSFSLDPGDYVLFCNLISDVGGGEVNHFTEGMHTTFTVSG